MNFLSVEISDITAVIITILGIAAAILEIRIFRKDCKWPWKWMYLFKAFSALYMSTMFFVSIFNVWGADGRIDMNVGRIGAVLVLSSLTLGAVIQYKREGC